MLVSHKYRAIFIHIPKNAGTFVWKLLKFVDPDLVEYYKQTSRKTLHHKASEIKNILDFNPNGYRVFCVIRNPYDNIVSLYEYTKRNPDHPNHNIAKNLLSKNL